MPTNAATEPTDRSMWPAMMTITMPMARMRTYAFWLTRLIRLTGSRVFPPVRISNRMMMTTRAPRMPNWRPVDWPPPNIFPRSRIPPDFFSSGICVVIIGLHPS